MTVISTHPLVWAAEPIVHQDQWNAGAYHDGSTPYSALRPLQNTNGRWWNNTPIGKVNAPVLIRQQAVTQSSFAQRLNVQLSDQIQYGEAIARKSLSFYQLNPNG